MAWVGYVTGFPEDKADLADLGVNLYYIRRKNDDGTVTWRCAMSDNVFDKLQRHADQFVWYLYHDPTWIS